MKKAKKHLLYIEDEPIFAEVFKRCLERAGWKVSIAHNAQHGIDILDQNDDIQLILLDLFLPQHNGLVVLYHLQSYADWQQLPVVILSSHERSQFLLDNTALRELGVVQYLDKTATTPQILVSSVNAAATV